MIALKTNLNENVILIESCFSKFESKIKTSEYDMATVTRVLVQVQYYRNVFKRTQTKQNKNIFVSVMRDAVLPQLLALGPTSH